MGKANAVVVGCGAIGPVHAGVLSDCPDAVLYGVCDIQPDRADALAAKYGCKAYYDFDAVVCDPDVDVVHLCTPHYLHAPMAVEAARRGKHVVMEKPFAMNNREAAEAAEHIRESGVKLCAVLQNRYTPCIVKAKELIDGGTYGKVLGAKGLLTWHRPPEYYASGEWRGKWATEGGGLVINQAVHLLDLLTYLGGSCEAICASMDNRTLQGVIEVEDTAEATLYRTDGVRLHFFATNGYCIDEPFELEVQLERAALKLAYNRLYAVENGVMTEVAHNPDNVPGKAYWGNGHTILIDNFYATLAGKPRSYTSLGDGLSSVKLIDGLYTSAREHRRVEL